MSISLTDDGVSTVLAYIVHRYICSNAFISSIKMSQETTGVFRIETNIDFME